MMEKAKWILIVKVLLSVWIVIHGTCILVMPNANSFLGRQLSEWFYPYGNAVGLNVGWSFFSPDPANVLYLRYVVYFQNADKEAYEGFFPREKNRPASTVQGKRDLAVLRFMLLDHKRLGVLMGPWLCRQHKGAESVYMEYMMETVPPIDLAQTSIGKDVQELSQELQFIKVDHNCTQEQDQIWL